MAIWSTCAAILITSLPLRSADAPPADAEKKIIVTTVDLNRPYEVIEVFVQYQEFASMSFRGDPAANAINAAANAIRERARKAGADAIVGYRVELANRTQKDEGRVIVYGTVVKFIDPPVAASSP